MVAVDLGQLGRMAGNVIAVGRRGRTASAVGDFEAFLSAGSRDYFMSFAVPRPPPRDADTRPAGAWSDPLARLSDHFAANDRTLRLEFFAELFPNLPVALETAAVTRDKSAPVLVAGPDSFRPPRRTGLTMIPVESGNTVAVERFMSVQGDAFGVRIDSGPTGWRPILESGLADGSMIGRHRRGRGQGLLRRGADDRRRCGGTGRGRHPARLSPAWVCGRSLRPSAGRVFRAYRCAGLAVGR